MAAIDTTVKTIAVKETVLFLCLVFFGLALLPLAMYLVGQAFFGDYGDGGISGFYGQLQREFRDGEPAVWFLLLSPYLLWQLVRLTVWSFRRSKRMETSFADRPRS